jgi:hypothetical protein
MPAPSVASFNSSEPAVSRIDRKAGDIEHRSRVEAGIHLHQRDAGFRVSGEQRPLDGRGAPPTRQQGGVHIDAPEPGPAKERGRQDEAIRSDDEHIDGTRRHLRLRGSARERRRLAYGNRAL